MAGGALSFAEILREEYVYLHGTVPQQRAEIKPKHLREVGALIQRMCAAPAAGDGRYSLLQRSWRSSRLDQAHDEHAAVAAAFRGLAEAEQVETSDGEKVTLFEALLLDDHFAEKLRSVEIVRKLVSVPFARRTVFANQAVANLVAETPELVDVFRAASAAVRLLAVDDPQLFRRFPPLLATIADDPGLEARLSIAHDAKAARRSLIEEFSAATDPRTWSDRLRTFGRDPEAMDIRWLRACNSSAVLNAIDEGKEPPRDCPPVPMDERTMFNSILLETAFLECFTDSYDVRSMNAALHERDMAALCLSGGGIRSATFNLGILQGLADHGLLAKFHYLSTVSGGGYIGSWLSSWIRRHNEGAPGVCSDLAAPPADPEEPEVKPIQHLRAYSSYLAPSAAVMSTDTWTLVAIYIRNLLLNWTILIPFFAAILALPRMFESASFAAWRAETPSTGLGWFAFGSAAVAVIAVAMLRPKSEKRSGPEKSIERIRIEGMLSGVWLLPLLASAVTFCVFWASLRSGRGADAAVVDGPMIPVVLAIGSGIAGAIYAGRRLSASVAGTGLLARLWCFFRLVWRWEHLPYAIREIATTAGAGLIAGLLLRYTFATLFPPDLLGQSRQDLLLEQYVCFAIPLFLLVFYAQATLLVGLTTTSTNDHDREWWARSAARMFVCAIAYMAGTLVVMVLPVLIVQSPYIIAPLGGISGVVSWILGRSEQLKKKSGDERTSSKLMALSLKIAAGLTAALLLALIAFASSRLLAVIQGIEPMSLKKIFGDEALPLACEHLQVLRHTTFDVAKDFVLWSFALATLMSYLLDVNIYSMHGMYRNRLIRAYLGASRWFRRPDAFTGFDPQDNLDMFELRAEALWTSNFIDFEKFTQKLDGHAQLAAQLSPTVRERLRAYVSGGPKGPHRDEIRSEVVRELNTRMVTHDLRHNVEAPRRLEVFAKNREYLQEVFDGLITPVPREAETPAEAITLPTRFVKREYAALHAMLNVHKPARKRPPIHILNAALNLVGGENLAWQERKADSFTISPLHSGNRRLGFRDSFDYGRQISLGTAMAVSGAAVSPNMGYHSSPVVTFLMTLFNARLGWWLGNPSSKLFGEPGPRLTLECLIAEAMGWTNDQSDWVFLSDGGHFDNLGLYEMVRRRCHYIVVADATADSKYAFGDLGNTVRKIRVDTGIPITLRTAYLPPEPGKLEGKYCAVGLIHYGDVDDVAPQHRFGYLLYVKPAVYSECPPDVRNYKNERELFPHESTVDQFFGESQFESYRALGRHIIGQICRDELDQPVNHPPGVGAFIDIARLYVDAKSKGGGSAAATSGLSRRKPRVRAHRSREANSLRGQGRPTEDEVTGPA